MTNFMIILAIIGGVCLVGVGFKYLKKKGVKVDSILNDTETVVEDAGVVIKAGKSLTDNKVFTILDLIATLSEKAIKRAQQLYISNQLPMDQRKTKARESINAGLDFAGIKVTPEMDTLIDTAIDSFIYDSKTDDEKRGQEQNTLQKQVIQLQQDKAQLQASVSDVQQQVTALQQKITTVQNTVAQ